MKRNSVPERGKYVLMREIGFSSYTRKFKGERNTKQSGNSSTPSLLINQIFEDIQKLKPRKIKLRETTPSGQNV